MTNEISDTVLRFILNSFKLKYATKIGKKNESTMILGNKIQILIELNI